MKMIANGSNKIDTMKNDLVSHFYHFKCIEDHKNDESEDALIYMAGRLMTFPVRVVNSRRGEIRSQKGAHQPQMTDAQIPKIASRKDASHAKTCIMIEARKDDTKRVEDSEDTRLCRQAR